MVIIIIIIIIIPKVDRFITLPFEPLVPICSKIGSFVLKISCNKQTEEQMEGQVENITPPTSLDWWRYKVSIPVPDNAEDVDVGIVEAEVDKCSTCAAV